MELSMDVQAELVVRLVVAAVLGAAIGLERELHDHPAGMRTHLLVSLGSAGFTILSIEAFGPGADGAAVDPGRVAAQIVSGIGFLGAGAILKEGATVRGLTTAASLWVVAAVGMAAGTGAWVVATAVVLLVLLSLWPLRLLTERLVGPQEHRILVQLTTADPESLGRVVTAVAGGEGSIAHLETSSSPDGGLSIEVEIRVRDVDAGAAMTAVIADLEAVQLVSAKALGD